VLPNQRMQPTGYRAAFQVSWRFGVVLGKVFSPVVATGQSCSREVVATPPPHSRAQDAGG
jgi:hypothetical protein